ncbi:hypothetical protein Bca52824_032630 [Brassica carinata]|uniref:NYN domain-containing protein n=1 Tax=Brassica carinata TaxID=52824 RepID=A0A8X7SBF1_BRACI|nr:hypothetical protein Bca52824_032630 [Brassica carinata]
MRLMLISSHEQLEILAPTLFQIQPLLSSILLAHPGRKEGSEWLWKSLRSVTIRSFAPVPHFGFRSSAHMATTTVLWDIDSCPLPDSFSPSLAGRSIKSALKNSGYLGPVTITAMSNLHLNPPPANLLEALFSSGIHITNIFGYCLSQLFDWRTSAQPPATLMLICGDTTLEMLSEPLFCDFRENRLTILPSFFLNSSPHLNIFRICDVGLTILVAHPGRKPVSADLLKSFLSVVSRDRIWESFLGGSADDKDEALEYKCREMGYVSCEVCEFSGFSLKDLTTHFSSEEHVEEAGGSSKAEPPIKKQKKVSSIVEDEAAVEGKGASEKEERLTRYESRDSDIADLVRISVEEYLSKVPEQQSLSLPPQPPPPPPPQQSVTSPPAKASISSSPAKAITIVAQASDVDFVTVSPSKDPAVGRGRRLKFKRRKTAENKARLAEERKKAADLKKKLKAEIKQEVPKRRTRGGVITLHRFYKPAVSLR